MIYAGFWRRAGATLADLIVLSPFVVLSFYLKPLPAVIALPLATIVSAAYPAYTIYFHGRSGQTLGKRFFGIRLRMADGGAVTWKVAFVRQAPDLIANVAFVASSASMYLAVSQSARAAMNSVEFGHLYQTLRPTYAAWIDAAYRGWFWSELVVVLTNQKRRALHDFLAGTVVLREQPLADRFEIVGDTVSEKGHGLLSWRRLSVTEIFRLWGLSYLALWILGCVAFAGFRHQPHAFLIAASVAIGGAAALLTVASTTATVAGTRRWRPFWWSAAVGCQILFGGALCFASLSSVQYGLMFDSARTNANIAEQLHRDRLYPLVGYWKHRCEANFGLAIDRAGRGKYSVSFCAPGGCLRSRLFTDETKLYGTRKYRVVDENTIEVRERAGFERYLRCE